MITFTLNPLSIFIGGILIGILGCWIYVNIWYNCSEEFEEETIGFNEDNDE